ncbi:hypothetical protein CcI49_02715 [Frankia sp. CcI49]|nr:hypothetical protein CcI49_02715 [Frankia sp. CcI49]
MTAPGLTDPCGRCGRRAVDHEPVFGEGGLYVDRGPSVDEPGGWATDPSTGEPARITPHVIGCLGFVPAEGSAA